MLLSLVSLSYPNNRKLNNPKIKKLEERGELVSRRRSYVWVSKKRGNLKY
jgi:hypothetical protein